MNEELEFLKSVGSDAEILEKVNDKFKYSIKKGDVESSLDSVVKNVQAATTEFLGTHNEYGIPVINAITSSIYIPDAEANNELYLTFFASGKNKINERSLFDVASITKIYTLLLAFRLEELGFFSFQDKIADLNPNFDGLEDFTVEDIVLLHGEMRTMGNIVGSATESEARKILNTLYLVNKDRDKNKYTDFGVIALAETMVRVVSERTKYNHTFKTLFSEYLLEPLCIYPEDTVFNPRKEIAFGNGDDTELVHDPKTRALGNMSGAAGIYTNCRGLATLANRLFSSGRHFDCYESACTLKQLESMGRHTYPNSDIPHRGLVGMYLKHPQGGGTFAPSAYSNSVFSHQGYTGSLAIFDPILKIHNGILVDSVIKGKGKEGYGPNQKPIGFMDAFNKYEEVITQETLVATLVKKYYEKKNKESFTIHKKYIIG